MDIIRRKNDYVVVYAGDSFILTGTGLSWEDKLNKTVTTKKYEKLVVSEVPDNFRGCYYTYDKEWELTPYGIIKLAERQSISDEITKSAQDTIEINNDVLISFLRNNTIQEIETYISDQFSELSVMTDSEIKAYIAANVNDLSSAKNILTILGKDLSQTMIFLKIVTKLTIYMIKKQL